MIVYVVTQGSYSSYHICGVTLDREKAEKMAKFCTSGGEEGEVEEYDTEDVDTKSFGRPVPVYEVFLNSNGSSRVYISHYIDENKSFKPKFTTGRYPFYSYISATLMAKDEEHALKITQDEWVKRRAAEMGL